MQETWVWSLGQEDPLEKAMATHSSTLAWKIPWTEKPGRLQSMGSQRVGHWTLHFHFIAVVQGWSCWQDQGVSRLCTSLIWSQVIFLMSLSAFFNLASSYLLWHNPFVGFHSIKSLNTLLYLVFLEVEPGPSPKAALLFLDCSSFVSTSTPFPD